MQAALDIALAPKVKPAKVKAPKIKRMVKATRPKRVSKAATKKVVVPDVELVGDGEVPSTVDPAFDTEF